MDAMQYWKQQGRERILVLCAEVGTSYDYWKHLAHKRKRPGVELARKLVHHSQGALSLDELLPAKSEMKKSTQCSAG